MRKLVSALFSAAVLFCLVLFIPVTVSAEGENTSQTWSIQDGVLTISGEGYMDNYSFGQAPWYSSRASITGIVVEEGLTSIGSYAFADLRQVTSVSIPQSITEIGTGAFRLCTKLASVDFSGTRLHQRQIYIYTGNTYLEKADWNCRTEGTVIDTGSCGDAAVWTYYDDGKLVISGSGAMYDDCNFLILFPINISPIIEAVVESGITRIGSSAFYGQGCLESATIEEGVEVIGSRAFENCAVLTSVTIPESVTQIENNAFAWSENLADVNIPSGVTDIGYAAFSGCKSLTQVTIPEGVVNIGSGAFAGCAGLTEIAYYAADAVIEVGSIFTDCGTEGDGIQFTIGDQVGSIPDDFLRDVSALTSVTIGNSVTSIGSGAFYGCSRLTEVVIPDSVTEIGRDAFRDCTALTEIVIPSGATSIKIYTFFNCMALTDVTIPSTVTSVEEDAFFNCVSLQEVWYDGTVEEWYEVDIYESFEDNHWLTDALTHCSDGDIFAGFGSCGDNLTWTLTGNGHLTISGTGAMYEFEEDEIPWKNYYFTDVLIEEGVTSICAKAFYQRGFLETVVIPGSVKQIGDYAFEDSSLKSVTIGEGVERIGDWAFHLCFGLTEISIPGSVVDFGEYAFFNCNYLREAVLSSGIKAIGNHAFDSCISLEKINIPDTVTSIGEGAFFSCEKLQSVMIPDSVTYIGEDAFNRSGLTAVEIPDGIETIEMATFCNCEDLKNVIIPSSVKTIKNAAFSFCTSLTKMILPYGITSIGEDAFATCWNMEELVIPDSVTSIGKGAFYNCMNLTKLTIPGGITTINESAFYNCALLSTIKIGEGVKTIKAQAFAECDSLRTLILPLSLTSIEDNVFSASKYLEDIYYYGTVLEWYDINIAEGNEYLSKADLRCLDGIIEYTGNTVYASGTLESRISWSITGSLLSFSGIGPIDLYPLCPWSSDRYRVHSAKVGEGITEIGYETFKSCFNMKYIMLPHSLSYINIGAFSGCSKLSTVYYFGTIAEWKYVYVDEDNDCLTGAVIRCKDGVINDNGNAVYYSGTCGAGLTWTLTEGWLLTISGTGDMYDYSYNEGAPWSNFSGLTAVVIEEGVTSIGDNAFLGLACTVTIPSTVTHIGKYGVARNWYSNADITIIGNTPIIIEEYAFYESRLLTFPNISGNITDNAFIGCEMLDVIIPSGVTSIGAGAFSGSRMNSISIPDSVTEIGDYAFSNFSGIKNITIPDSVTSIGERAFYEGTDLQSINIPGGVTEIEEETFAGCTGLISIEIAEGVEVIGANAFYNCSALTNLVIPDSVTFINYCAFYNCSGLTSLKLGESLQEIGSSAFNGCTALTSVVLPESVTYIRPSAFAECSSLKSITIPSGIEDIEESVFLGCGSLASAILMPGVKHIKDWAFSGCSSLTGVTIPSSVTGISHSAFIGTPWLEAQDGTVVLDGVLMVYRGDLEENAITEAVIPEGITAVGEYVFNNCTNLEWIEIPACVTEIGLCAFAWCSNLAEVVYEGTWDAWNEIEIDYGNETLFQAVIECSDVVVTASGYIDTNDTGEASWYLTDEGLLVIRGTGEVHTWYAFGHYKESILSAEVGEGITAFGQDVFYDCYKMTNIKLPSSLRSIDNEVFENVDSLTDVYYNGTRTEWNSISIHSENEGLANAVIHCTDGVIVDGLSVDASGEIGDNHVWIFTGEGLLIIRGTGAMPDFDENGDTGYDTPWKDLPVLSVEIQDGVTGIGAGSFSSLGSLTSVIIPDCVTEIGDEAFANCPELKSVKFIGDQPSFGTDCFYEDSCRGYYPYGNESWDELPELGSGNNVTWLPYSLGRPQGYGIAQLPDQLRYQVNEEINLTGIQVHVIFTDGLERFYTSEDIDDVVYDFSEIGEKKVTISVAGITLSFKVMVYDYWEETIDPSEYPESAHPYADHTDTVYTYQKPGTFKLVLEFSDETVLSETEDTIIITDFEGNEIGTYTGSALAGQTVEVPGDTVHIRLVSDEELSAFGFSLNSITAYHRDGFCEGAHTWGGVIYTWAEDNSTVTASHTCMYCGETESETVEPALEITVPAECETPGQAVLTASFKNALFKEQSKTAEVPALGHKYELNEWNWTEYEAASAVFVCRHNNSHTETVEALITSETVPASCETAGKTVYTAAVTFEGEDYFDVKEEITAPAFGHNYVLSGWTWNGYESAAATFVCQHDENHKEVPVSDETTPATCETAGKTVYTAQVIFGGNVYTDVKEEVIPAAGHDYQLTGWTWNGVESASASFVCRNDNTHEKTVDAVITFETTPAGCETAGKTVYTAAAVLGEDTFTDTKEVTIPAAGHTAAAAVIEGRTEATCTKAGGYDEVTCCSACGAELSREHHTIAALGHDYELSGWTWASDYSTAKATFVCRNNSSHKKTVSASITSKKDSNGNLVYTATVTLNGKTYTDKNGDNYFRNPFTDVSESASYYSSLVWAVQNGIISGTSATTFSPNASCTRYQFAVMLYKLAGKPDVTGLTVPFTDVPTNKSYYKAVCWAYKNKIISGTSATTFSPDAEVTRYQVVAVLYKMAGKPAVSGTNPFTDVPSNASYYNAVMWAVQNNITKGTSATKFSPNATCQRYQMVVFLNKFNKIYKYV